MNASHKIQSLRDGLAQFFDKPTSIEFTDGYGQVYAGISNLMTETVPEPIDKGKIILPVTISFVKIIRVRVVKQYGIEYYIPAIEEPKPINAPFYLMQFRIKTLQIRNRTHAWVEDHPKEHLVFSRIEKDFIRFNREILGIEIPEMPTTT